MPIRNVVLGVTLLTVLGCASTPPARDGLPTSHGRPDPAPLEDRPALRVRDEETPTFQRPWVAQEVERRS